MVVKVVMIVVCMNKNHLQIRYQFSSSFYLQYFLRWSILIFFIVPPTIFLSLFVNFGLSFILFFFYLVFSFCSHFFLHFFSFFFLPVSLIFFFLPFSYYLFSSVCLSFCFFYLGDFSFQPFNFRRPPKNENRKRKTQFITPTTVLGRDRVEGSVVVGNDQIGVVEDSVVVGNDQIGVVDR